MEWYKSISAIDFRQVDDALKYENDKYNNEERQLRSSSAPTNPTKEVLDLANRMNYDNLDTVANRDNQGDLS